MYEVNTKYPAEVPEGLWLDYAPHNWIIVIKDPAWTVEELRKGRKSHMVLSFVQQGIVDAFLLEIEDCMECSDIPFCMADASDDMIRCLKEDGEEKVTVLMTDGADTIRVSRTYALKKEHAKLLRECLCARLEENISAPDFDRAYEKLAETYEPFELEPSALFTERL